MIHEKMNIILECGIAVEVLDFSYGYTYKHLQKNITDPKLNKYIYDQITYPKNWHERRHLKISPDVTELNSGIMGLKPTHYSVFVHSNFTLDDDHDGTCLVITWLDDVPNNKLISDIIYQGIKSVNWLEEAENFNY